MNEDYMEFVKRTGKHREYMTFLRYGLKLKVTEIAEIFGMTRQDVYYYMDSYKGGLENAAKERELLK